MQKALTPQDRKKLKSKIWRTLGFVVFAIAIFSAIYFFVLRDSFQHTNDFELIPTLIFGVFGVFFLGVLGYMISIFIKDLNAGVKNCYEGIIEDKKLNIKQSTSHSRSHGHRGSSNSKTNTKRYYYIIVDGIEHEIEYNMYLQVKVGDLVYFEVAPKSRTVLFYEVLENAAVETKTETVRFDTIDYPDSKIKKVPLSRKDEAVIRRFYDKKLRRRLVFLVIVGLPIFGLIYNGFPMLALYIFPLPIIFLYQLYKTIQLYQNFKKSIEEGKKQLTITQVTDKLFTTISNNNRRHQKYTITTTYKTILVPDDLYEDIYIEDEISVHEATHLPVIIGITLEDVFYRF